MYGLLQMFRQGQIPSSRMAATRPETAEAISEWSRNTTRAAPDKIRGGAKLVGQEIKGHLSYLWWQDLPEEEL